MRIFLAPKEAIFRAILRQILSFFGQILCFASIYSQLSCSLLRYLDPLLPHMLPDLLPLAPFLEDDDDDLEFLEANSNSGRMAPVMKH